MRGFVTQIFLWRGFNLSGNRSCKRKRDLLGLGKDFEYAILQLTPYKRGFPMFTTLTMKELPLYHEIDFDRKRMAISFSLCPEANGYFLSMLPKADIWADSYKACKFAPFVFNGNNWGFGGIFRRNSKVVFRDGWVTWECKLPKNATWQALDEISGSIKFITDVMELFIHEHKVTGIQTERQFMTIDGIIVRSSGHFHQAGLGFSFSYPVLEFCRKIWEDKQIYDAIIKSMENVWKHLWGKKKIRDYERYSFRISHCQDDSRLISLSCPGDCA